MLSVNINHNIDFFFHEKTYVMIHVIKHDMDHNMDLNDRRKIRPMHSSPDVGQNKIFENGLCGLDPLIYI